MRRFQITYTVPSGPTLMSPAMSLNCGGRSGTTDVHVVIEGPAADRLGKKLRREQVGPFPGGVKFYLSSESGGRKLRKRYLKAFAAAKSRLLVAHAYFLPDAGLIRALRGAAQRGVDVRLLLAGNSDVPFAHAATMSLYRRLLVAGVQIFNPGTFA